MRMLCSGVDVCDIESMFGLNAITIFFYKEKSILNHAILPLCLTRKPTSN
jgi:hypothetical protein